MESMILFFFFNPTKVITYSDLSPTESECLLRACFYSPIRFQFPGI